MTTSTNPTHQTAAATPGSGATPSTRTDHFSFTPSGADMDETARSSISSLKHLNDSTDSLRKRAQESTAGTSSLGVGANALNAALPAVTGILANKAVGTLWKKTTHSDSIPDSRDRSSNLFQALVFAVISAIVGTLVARWTSGLLDRLNHR